MKRIIISAIILLCVFSNATEAYSQNKSGVVSSSSMIVTRTKIKKEKEPIKITWQNNVDATISQFYGVTYTGGWRFGNFMFLGFGTGIHINSQVLPWDEDDLLKIQGKDNGEVKEQINGYDYYSPSRISAPVYAQLRFRFMKTKVAPFLTVSGGALIGGDCNTDGYNAYDGYPSFNTDYDSDTGHYSYATYYKDGTDVAGFAEIMIGIDLRLKNDSNISLGLGPIWTTQKENYLLGDYRSRAIGGFRLGYSF